MTSRPPFHLLSDSLLAAYEQARDQDHEDAINWMHRVVNMRDLESASQSYMEDYLWDQEDVLKIVQALAQTFPQGVMLPPAFLELIGRFQDIITERDEYLCAALNEQRRRYDHYLFNVLGVSSENPRALRKQLSNMVRNEDVDMKRAGEMIVASVELELASQGDLELRDKWSKRLREAGRIKQRMDAASGWAYFDIYEELSVFFDKEALRFKGKMVEASFRAGVRDNERVRLEWELEQLSFRERFHDVIESRLKALGCVDESPRIVVTQETVDPVFHFEKKKKKNRKSTRNRRKSVQAAEGGDESSSLDSKSVDRVERSIERVRKAIEAAKDYDGHLYVLTSSDDRAEGFKQQWLELLHRGLSGQVKVGFIEYEQIRHADAPVIIPRSLNSNRNAWRKSRVSVPTFVIDVSQPKLLSNFLKLQEKS